MTNLEKENRELRADLRQVGDWKSDTGRVIGTGLHELADAAKTAAKDRKPIEQLANALFPPAPGGTLNLADYVQPQPP